MAPASHVEGAPRPGRAANIDRPGEPPTSSAFLWVPRVLLYPPRLATKLGLAPVRGALWLYDRYDVRERVMDLLFNDARTFGVYPLLELDTEYGSRIALHMIHKTLFGKRETLRVEAGYGGEADQLYRVALASGDRFDGARLHLLTSYQRRPNEQFFGLGNADAVAPGEGPDRAPRSNTAIETEFGQEVALSSLRAEISLTDSLKATASGIHTLRDFGPSGGRDGDPQLPAVFDTRGLPGWSDGVNNVHSQLELRYDTRRPTSRFISRASYGTGWLLSGWTGYTAGIGEDASGYVRSGADVQRFINLHGGRRVLALRALVDGILADPGEVPFSDLPRLGGATRLRGYPTDRFHDRHLTLTSAEYQWEINRWLAAHVFVDAGRVWQHLSDVGLEDLRVGYGAGLQAHSDSSFLLRAQLASSEEGVFAHITFSPFYEPRPRIRRRGR